MAGIRTTTPGTDRPNVRFEQTLAAAGSTDWVLLGGGIRTLCIGTATAATFQIERSTSDPAAGAQPMALTLPLSGNPSAEALLILAGETGAAWYRVNVTSLNAGTITVALTGAEAQIAESTRPDGGKAISLQQTLPANGVTDWVALSSLAGSAKIAFRVTGRAIRAFMAVERAGGDLSTGPLTTPIVVAGGPVMIDPSEQVGFYDIAAEPGWFRLRVFDLVGGPVVAAIGHSFSVSAYSRS